MNLTITIHRSGGEELVKKLSEKDRDFLWGITEEEHGSIIVSKGDCENVEVLSDIVKALSFAKEKAESELELQKEENNWKKNNS